MTYQCLMCECSEMCRPLAVKLRQDFRCPKTAGTETPAAPKAAKLDRVITGRHPKINKEQARELRAASWTDLDIAKKFGVTPTAISKSIGPRRGPPMSKASKKYLRYRERYTLLPEGEFKMCDLPGGSAVWGSFISRAAQMGDIIVIGGQGDRNTKYHKIKVSLPIDSARDKETQEKAAKMEEARKAGLI